MSADRRGIHTIHDLRERCDRLSNGCWIWPGAVDQGRPVTRIGGVKGLAAGASITAVLLGRAAERRPDQRWYVRCGERLCLSPRCLMLGSHGDALRCAAAVGRLRRTQAKRARDRAARRRQADVSPAWHVQWALESPQSAPDIAHALGVNRATVSNWRRGRQRPDLVCGPFDELMRLAA
jgi:hypothetical protein